MKTYIKYILIAFAVCVSAKIVIGIYFNDREVDEILNQLSWVYIILFLMGMIAVRSYFYFFKKNKPNDS